MINTPRIKTDIEPAIKAWLKQEFDDTTFQERQVKFPAGGSYTFDAVSQDNRIVAAIIYDRANAGTKHENTAGLKKTFSVLEQLKHLSHDTVRMVVFTDLDLLNLVQRRASRLGIRGIKLLLCPLPPDKKDLLDQILDAANQE
ncbi:hypothetical protein ABFB09_03145 [Dehalogenimonas sp. THU2]|uniref:hypothetical protein n=1 Tax=Dehalogenimonas sp. THU2 TaxID=3151121 RepID=UPI003218CD54